MNTPRTLIVPGWRDSGPRHWQSLWAALIPGCERVKQDNWLNPSRQAWVGSISDLILSRPEPVVIVAHSLGCIATTHLPPPVLARVKGALLVAPADPERRAVLQDFAPVPFAALPFRSLIVASSNDPYCTFRRATAYSRAWGSELVRLQDAGHINVDAGFGHWPLGLALLGSFGVDVQQAAAHQATSPYLEAA